MKIGISGASGQLGRKVIELLSQQDGQHQLLGISRSPGTVPAKVNVRFGDYDSPETLVRAYEALDRLLLIPSAEVAPGVRATQLKAAIAAAKQAGVGHVFLISAAGTREQAAPSLGEAYWVGEQALMGLIPRWTILRMNYYAESMADEIKMSLGGGVLAGLGDERVAYISRDDVAAAAAGALRGDGHAGAIYNLTGPAVVTGSERAALVSQIVGKPIGFVTVTAEQLRVGLAQAGLPALIQDVMVEIKTTMAHGNFDILTGDVQRLAGRSPRPLRDVLTAKLT